MKSLNIGFLFVFILIAYRPMPMLGVESIQGYWVGVADKNGEKTKLHLELELNGENILSGRWSLPSCGMSRIPLQNAKFQTEHGKFSADLMYIGFGIGKISGNASGESMSCVLHWHGQPIKLKMARREPVSYEYTMKEIEFTNENTTLRGTLVMPNRDGKSPAVVFVHGSSGGLRWWGMDLAGQYARQGIASLIFDKRGCGESTGNWTQSSLNDLAKDVMAGVDFLKKQDSIDAEMIGVYGVSQGGWVIGRACATTDDIAFAMINSGGGVSPREESIWSYMHDLDAAGMAVHKSEARVLIEMYMKYLKTGEERDELMTQIDKVRGTPWYRVLSLHRILPVQSNRPNWQWVATYDPMVDIRKMKIPVLVMFGDHDRVQPSQVAIKKWNQAFTDSNHLENEVCVFEGAGHGIRIGGHSPTGWPRYADGFVDKQLEWLAEITGDPNSKK